MCSPYGIACSNRLIRCAEVVPQGTFSCPNRQFTLSHPAVEHSSLDKTRRCRPQPPDERVAQHCYPPGDLLLPFGQFTLCRTQRRVTDMCSSPVSDTAVRLRKTQKKKSSAAPLRVSTLQISPCPLREKGRKSEGGKPQVVYPLVRPRRAAGASSLPAGGATPR